MESLKTVEKWSIFDEVLLRLTSRAKYGRDQDAQRLLEKLATAFLFGSARGFWNYLYDWLLEAEKLVRCQDGRES